MSPEICVIICLFICDELNEVLRGMRWLRCDAQALYKHHCRLKLRLAAPAFGERFQTAHRVHRAAAALDGLGDFQAEQLEHVHFGIFFST